MSTVGIYTLVRHPVTVFLTSLFIFASENVRDA